MTTDRTGEATTERAVPSHRRRPSALALFGTISVRGYVIAAAASFAVVLLAWAGAVAAGLAPETFLPSPGAVLDRLGSLWADGTLALDIGDSVVRIAVGFTIATLLAIPIGILIGTYPLAEAVVEPLVDFVRYMPVVGFVTPVSAPVFRLSETSWLASSGEVRFANVSARPSRLKAPGNCRHPDRFSGTSATRSRNNFLPTSSRVLKKKSKSMDPTTFDWSHLM